ncbi:MAG TPA: ABC transporter substrate-binding protein [Thermomicrobiales bacterium]
MPANLTGKLTLYTSAVQTDADGLKAAFNKKYPNVAVTIYRDGTEKVIAKLHAEQDAKSIQADVLLIADAPTMETLKAGAFLQTYKSPFASAFDKQFVDAEGYYTGTKIINSGIAVNTTANLPKPATWKDLLKPDYKGKLVSPSPQYSGAAALNYAVFLNNTTYGAAFVKGLQTNGMTIVQANGDALTKIISGEAPVGIVTDNGVRAAKAKGSPVEMIYPTDGAIPVTEPVGIVAGTKNLDAAKAFVDFVLSPDGQALIVTQNYIPLLPGVAPPTGVPATIKEFPVDAPAVAKQLPDAKKQFTDIFGA